MKTYMYAAILETLHSKTFIENKNIKTHYKRTFSLGTLFTLKTPAFNS